ncbi:Dehydrogenase/reductase SDR family member 12 [Vitis vinifera]|uniref:Dehydrogenase/reductase SDR family member 12 n=1 Tax=Vitis vinifera TaxID=29760 RepID=A0A438DPK2_VITVI|nr:Dehydrogenase/reductase SDR family member 12 [Vitis vinifera]
MIIKQQGTLKEFQVRRYANSIEGKNCIVTGANSGIGYATAEGLASRGANVYMVCRNKERGEAALSEIQSKTGNSNVHLEVCDLSSVSEIKSFASKFSKKDVPIHVLVNNAGLLEYNRITTSEGCISTSPPFVFQYRFDIYNQCCHCWKKLLLMLESSQFSSGGMYSVPLTNDLQFSDDKFDGVTQYARNKRVQVALTEKWAEMYKNKGIGFYAMHPGWAETSGLAKSLPGFYKLLSGNLRTIEEGADTVIWLALQPKEKLVSGAFYFDRAEAPKHLMFAATRSSHAMIDSIIGNLRSFSGLSALSS